MSRARGVILALLVAGASVVAIVWASNGEEERVGLPAASREPRRSTESETEPVPAAQPRCVHPSMTAEIGTTWRYRFEGSEGASAPGEAEIVLLSVENDRDGTEFALRGRQEFAGERVERTVIVDCVAEVGAELPLEAFVQEMFGDPFDDLKCVYPFDLVPGVEVIDEAVFDDGSLERSCTVVQTDVRVETPAGVFDTIEVRVTDRGTYRERDVESTTTFWLAQNASIVRARSDAGEVTLVSYSGPR